MKKTNLIYPALMALTACTQQPTAPQFRLEATPHPLSTAAIEQQVNDLYARMTPEERLAQLRSMYLADLFDGDRLDTARCAELIPYGIGHFSQYASQENTSADSIRDKVCQVQAWLMSHTPSGIPAIFHEEVLTGVTTRDATIYPQQIGLACSFNTELAELKTRQTAQDLRSIGGRMALSPMTDVCRNPHFNRNEESYGEDGYLSAAMGVAFVRGLQDGGLDKSIAACSKHFLGYGGGGDAQPKELMEEILLPHEAMIRIAGSKVVMTGYHPFHGINCVANSELMEDILRQYLGFDGIMVSDYGSIAQIAHVQTQDERTVAAFNAGNDVDFPKGENYARLPELIEQGLVTPEAFERAVKRVLTLKASLGLLSANPDLYAEGHIEFDRPDERQTSYQLATQSVVLLQNNGVLPLSADKGKKVFLTGPNANSMWAMVGDYTYPSMVYFWQQRECDSEHPHIVKLTEGMTSRKPADIDLTYSRGCNWTDVVETRIGKGGDERAEAWLTALLDREINPREEANRQEALRLAAESDVIIAAMGENAMLCGENRDRTSLRLPGSQEQYIEELIATGKPVVLVMFGGRAQVVSNIADRCAAIIQAWYPGEEGGNAVADILYGHVSPSGKLSVSYPNVELDEDICYNYAIAQDSRIAWPFGFGLSYTEFSYDHLQTSVTVPDADDLSTAYLTISCDITNTGSVAADEIVQLYLSPTAATQTLKPIQLQGFGRVNLQPGQTHRVEFVMSAQQLGHYADGQWSIDPGQYTIKVGASSADIRLSADVTLEGQPTVMPLRTRYFAEMQ